MWFLIRAAFWFSLVLLALPFGTAGDGQSVGPVQALMAAREAVGDMAGLCERKPDVCETGRSALHTISIRARETANIAAAMLENSGSDEEGADAPAAPDLNTTTGSVPVKAVGE